jgi:hypothetical protein
MGVIHVVYGSHVDFTFVLFFFFLFVFIYIHLYIALLYNIVIFCQNDPIIWIFQFSRRVYPLSVINQIWNPEVFRSKGFNFFSPCRGIRLTIACLNLMDIGRCYTWSRNCLPFWSTWVLPRFNLLPLSKYKQMFEDIRRVIRSRKSDNAMGERKRTKRENTSPHNKTPIEN